MSRLIVVSNRVALPDPAGESQGGLAMAMAAALREYSGVWFGWSGQTIDNFSGEISIQRGGGVTAATVDLEEQDVEEYYNGYANRTLWPLFHYRMGLATHERNYGSGYARVNARFAQTIYPLLLFDDVVWIQDYHFIPLGRELRARGVSNPLGFFLHIPWPARELILTLPNHEELVESLFHYDVIGFQTEEWREAFESYVIHEVGGQRLSDGRLTAFGKTVRVQAFPIGIDAAAFKKVKESQAAQSSYDRMLESKAGRKMILGVDRLDYSKGLEEKFYSYERLLQNNPSLRGQMFLLQISTETRVNVDEYRDIRERLDALCGRINGTNAEMDWIPIRHLHRLHRRDELAGLYRAADVCLVTPLRDGMNLVAKEYVGAQDEKNPGVLVLSRFAGAAQQMDQALIVNPFSHEDVADAIKRALSMSLKERIRRWQSLMEDVEKEDIVFWRDSFVKALQNCRAPKKAGGGSKLPPAPIHHAL